MKINIAIDGPAGSGKSTIAKLIAKELDLMYINTGAMYRAVTLRALENNIMPTEIDRLCELIEGMDMCFINDKLHLNGENVDDILTLPNISNNVSSYAAIRKVRKKLVENMRKISEKYNVIMDGRDIGTVVLRDAEYKFFLTASAEARAERRFKELKSKNIEVEYNEILQSIKQRDYLDENRDIDPLIKADDAFEIDSSSLNIEQVVNVMLSKIVNN